MEHFVSNRVITVVELDTKTRIELSGTPGSSKIRAIISQESREGDLPESVELARVTLSQTTAQNLVYAIRGFL
jgi:hypothetical protein